MADEAILRIVIEERGRGDTAGPEPATPLAVAKTSDAESSSSMVVASARALRLAVDTLTVDISRASRALNQVAVQQPKAASAPLPSGGFAKTSGWAFLNAATASSRPST